MQQGVLSREPAAPVPPDESPTPSGQGAHFGLLLLCFFLSGVAALIYQTAWTRLFSFVFGTSELAVASVLAAYMGGLAVGAAVVARLTPRIRRPVLVYGLLELGIGRSHGVDYRSADAVKEKIIAPEPAPVTDRTSHDPAHDVPAALV